MRLPGRPVDEDMVLTEQAARKDWDTDEWRTAAGRDNERTATVNIPLFMRKVEPPTPGGPG